MQIEIEISNYRAFAAPTRAKMEIKSDGFVALVGPNNSGKSSLLRFFYEFRNAFTLIARPNWQQGQSFTPPVSDTREIFSHGNTSDPIFFKILISDIPQINLFARGVSFIFTYAGHLACNIKTIYTTQEVVANINGNINGNPTIGHQAYDMSAIREACSLLAHSIYIGPFRNILNIGGTEDYFDLPIGEAFVQQWSKAQTGSDRAKKQKIATIIEQIERIFGFGRLEISAADNRKTLQTYLDGQPFNLSELGSGLTQFLVTLFATSFKEPSLILIDEPELNLHPTLQIEFLMALASHLKPCTNLGIILATHNIGLARSIGDKFIP